MNKIEELEQKIAELEDRIESMYDTLKLQTEWNVKCIEIISDLKDYSDAKILNS